MAENVRSYRRGIQHRKGDIKKEDFLAEFGFKDVVYSSSFVDSLKQAYLNYTYDSLKDLSSVFNITFKDISLRGENGSKSYIAFGKSPMHTGRGFLRITKGGKVVTNWILALDAYLGALYNVNSFFNDLNNEMTGEIPFETKKFLVILRTKENIQKGRLEDQIQEKQKKILELLDKLPFSNEIFPDEMADIQDTCDKFEKEMSKENMNRMFMKFKEKGLDLGDLESQIIQAVQEIENGQNMYEDASDFVNTKLYESAKKIKKDSNRDLIVAVLNAYIERYLQLKNQYNNFLVDDVRKQGFQIDSDEMMIYYEASRKFLDTIVSNIMPLSNIEINEEDNTENNSVNNLNDSINMETNVETRDSFSNNVDSNSNSKNNSETSSVDREAQINAMLESDKGKFKLTLFRELTKNTLLKVSDEKVLITNRVYKINFIDGFILNIQVKVFNDPKQNGHVLKIVCKEDLRNIKSSYEYSWDKELDYKDLVKFLNNIEIMGREEIAKDEKEKESIRERKFAITLFKDLCTKSGLSVDKGAVGVEGDNYRINFVNSYITYVIVPIQPDLDIEHSILIKTMREEVYHTWKGSLSYSELVNKMVIIEKEGRKQVKKDKQELEAEKRKMLEDAKRTKEEYKATKEKENNNVLLDVSNIETTKDLREKLNKYIENKNYRLKNSVNFLALHGTLQNNLQKDNIRFKVELTTISDDKLQGKAKNWNLDKDVLKVLRRSGNRKQMEGLIEGFVTYYMKEKKYSKAQKQMLIESVVYMLCKCVNLDVRTYCMGNSFESMIKSGNKVISNYLKTSYNLFEKVRLLFMEG